MTLTLLVDLDDTLLGNSMESFIPAYMSALGEQLSSHIPPEKMVHAMMIGTREMFANNRPDRTLEATFDPHFYPAIGASKAKMQDTIDTFYHKVFPSLKSVTQFIPQAVTFLEEALRRGYRIAIATNPLFPRAAILQRLEWAGISPQKYPLALIPSMETFHFAKPNPAFFAEFLGWMGWPDGPVVMIGNDLDHDIRGAQSMGLPAFWISERGANIPEGEPVPQGQGLLEDILPWIDATSPEALQSDYTSTNALIAILRGLAAAINGMATAFPAYLWNECPEPDEWCLTAIVCHLRDVEREVNLPRLRQIISEKNPFIPGIDTDAWANQRDYRDQDGAAALRDLMAARIETLDVLDSLSKADWAHPAQHAIFGPTDFKEIVHIIAQHDRLHTRQVYETIKTIWESVKHAA